MEDSNENIAAEQGEDVPPDEETNPAADAADGGDGAAEAGAEAIRDDADATPLEQSEDNDGDGAGVNEATAATADGEIAEESADGDDSSAPPAEVDGGAENEDAGPETASDDASKSTDDNDTNNINKSSSGTGDDDVNVEDEKMNVEDGEKTGEDVEGPNPPSATGMNDEDEGNETTEESSKEQPYSTRGRSTAGSGGEDKSSASFEPIGETLEELSRPKEPGASFLVETLTEEERRTRTRYIPDVEGMHVLRKAEVKDDIALARSLPTLVSDKGDIQSRAERLASSTGRRGSMDVDDVPSANDDGVTTIELPTRELVIPSDVFVAPEGVAVGDSEGTVVAKPTEKSKAKTKAPSYIETTVAFNPPRPPESIGAKKKHRVLRWERRPDDIEVDMKNYRRTVQRTRQELQKSEAELDRLETVDAHLRRHFINHLDLLKEEHDQLKDTIQPEIEKLSQFTGLSGGSRTRNRNAPKPSVVMRDVLTMLQKGDLKDIPMEEDPAVAAAIAEAKAPIGAGTPGIGGLNVGAFLDWDRSTTMKVSEPAMAWLEPGQTVDTPDGQGIVVAVLPIETHKEKEPSEDETKEDSTPQKAPPAEDKKTELSAAKKKSETTDTSVKEEEEKKAAREKEHDKYKSVPPSQVKVRISGSEKVFNMDVILLADNPAHYSDKKLAKRWKGMIKSALEVGPCVDVEGLGSIVTPAAGSTGSDSGSIEGNKPSVDVEDSGNGAPVAEEERPFLPVNASLFPTIAGRGNLLHSMKIGDIENELHDALYDGHGVLGRTSNPGVTADVRGWEDDEQEYLTLKASSLQLRNALYRQRRIRMLNERTANSMKDKIQRADDLVADMRVDLKNLKLKLEEELTELGISEEDANSILSKYYQVQQAEDEEEGDTSTPKRLKRASSVARKSMVLSEAVSGTAGTTSGSTGKLSDDDDLVTDDMSGDDMDPTAIQEPPSKKLRS